VKPWTPEEDDALVALADLPVAEQARRLERPFDTVKNRLKVLRRQGRIAPKQVNHRWTDAELAIIRATLDQPAATAFALLDDRTFSAVLSKRNELKNGGGA
jgi:hypothetical protein